jgi:signal transduction histidine kinase
LPRIRAATWSLALLLIVIGLVQAIWPRTQLLVPRESYLVETGFMSAFTRYFGGTVLLLFPLPGERKRLSWVAAGCIVLGIRVSMSDLEWLREAPSQPDSYLYITIFGHLIAAGLIAWGLAAPRPRPLGLRGGLVILAVVSGGTEFALTFGQRLPSLVGPWVLTNAMPQVPYSSLTPVYWVLAGLPALLSVIALLGLLRNPRLLRAKPWLGIAVALFCGAQMNAVLLAPTVRSVITTTMILRVLFAASVAIGGVIGLRGVAVRWAEVARREHALRRELRRLMQMREDLQAMVAHELGTPLATIRSCTATIARGTASPEEITRLSGIVTAEVRVMEQLIGDVQPATAHGDPFDVQVTVTPLAPILEAARDFALVLPGDHHVVVERVDAQVLADAGRIGQVLRNLLLNAAKYTPAGTPIEVRARSVAQNVRIEVKDFGLGLAPEEIPSLAEKYHRGSSAEAGAVAGQGLGLYICRRILEAHGSRIDIDSIPGQGTVCGFSLRQVVPKSVDDDTRAAD